jgi:hypothetical protein
MLKPRERERGRGREREGERMGWGNRLTRPAKDKVPVLFFVLSPALTSSPAFHVPSENTHPSTNKTPPQLLITNT